MGHGPSEEAEHEPPGLHGLVHGALHRASRFQLRLRPGHVRGGRGRGVRTTRNRGGEGERPEGQVLHHRRAGPLFERHRAELPQFGNGAEYGLQPEGRCGELFLPHLHEGDVPRFRNRDGRYLGRSRKRRTTRRRRPRAGGSRTHTARRHPAELADGAIAQRAERDGGLAARHVPGQPSPQPLLERDDQLDRQGRDHRADGTRAEPVQDQFVEMVLPHRSGAHGQWLPAR